jgi:hypothetical protein
MSHLHDWVRCHGPSLAAWRLRARQTAHAEKLPCAYCGEMLSLQPFDIAALTNGYLVCRIGSCNAVLCSGCEAYSMTTTTAASHEVRQLAQYEVESGLPRVGQLTVRSGDRGGSSTNPDLNEQPQRRKPFIVDILSRILDFAVSSAKEGGLHYALVSWDWQVALMEQEELWKRLACNRWPGPKLNTFRPRRYWVTLYRARALALRATRTLNPTAEPIPIEECGLQFWTPVSEDSVAPLEATSPPPPPPGLQQSTNEVSGHGSQQYRFRYRCPMLLEDMTKVGHKVYFCRGCQKAVHLVENQKELEQRANAGQCVSLAFKSGLLRDQLKLLDRGIIKVSILCDNFELGLLTLMAAAECFRGKEPEVENGEFGRDPPKRKTLESGWTEFVRRFKEAKDAAMKGRGTSSSSLTTSQQPGATLGVSSEASPKIGGSFSSIGGPNNFLITEFSSGILSLQLTINRTCCLKFYLRLTL